MADTNINTAAAGYTTRLSQLQDIVAFYAPILVEYLKVQVKDPEAARTWRQQDPILRELLNIHRQIAKRIGGATLD